MKTEKFSFIKFFICLYILSVHRHVFGKQYLQSYKITWRDKPILWWYSFVFGIYRDFRPYLKRLKPILIHAYNQKRATIKQQMAFWHIKDVNVDRYSDYSF